MSDPAEHFRRAIAAAGLEPPETIHADGNIHRFSASGKRGDDAGWYVLHLDGVPAGSFGDWRSGYSENWCAKHQDDLNPGELQAMRKKLRTTLALREAEQARRHGEAESTALSFWQSCEPALVHRYLSCKGVQAHRVRTDGHELVIPMRDTSGRLRSVQTIDPDGIKRFLRGGLVRGCFFAIGQWTDLVVVCEGFATGASIHEATGHGVAVAFNAGNLEPVAQALHGAYPMLKIILAADDDVDTPGNPGRSKAKAAALAVGGEIVSPHFPAPRPKRASDFNDLHALAGLSSVRACFDELLEL
jgi:putative DNA primase/helicase